MEETVKVKKSVTDILENAQDYALQLQGLLSDLKEAQNQIQYNADHTRSKIEEIFCNLKTLVVAALDHRKEQLTAEVCTIQENSLKPLQECYDVIKDKLNLTSELVDEGQKILQNIQDDNLDILKHFNRKSSTLGSLPEVPHPSQIPSISFNCNPLLLTQLVTSISSHGSVSQTNPVQIIRSLSKPGALLLQWEEIEMEKESSEFRLQQLQGDIRKTDQSFANFSDVYCGPETSCLVRDLMPNVSYSFRVCSRLDKLSSWSSWSLPYVTHTSLPPFEWDPNNTNYCISRDGKIASKITTMPSVLYSIKPQFNTEHSLIFRILDCNSSERDEGIGLSYLCNSEITSPLHPGIIFVNKDGAVFIDGKEMTTHLPPFHEGSTVTFESEGLPNNKMRVVIECEGKTIVYDWKIRRERTSDGIFFLMFFRKNGWKIMVE